MAQARDWRGRWTSGSGAGVAWSGSSRKSFITQGTDRGNLTTVSGSRKGGMVQRSYSGRRAGRGASADRKTAAQAARAVNRRAGSPVKGGGRIVTTRVSTKKISGGVTRTASTGGRRANRAAAKAYNRTQKVPAGSYIVGRGG